MTCPDRLRLPLSFDPDRLVRDLAALSSVDWIAHFVKQNYEGDWSVIPLRGVAGATHPIRMIYSDPTATAFEDTPMLRTPAPTSARCWTLSKCRRAVRAADAADRLVR